MWVVPAALPALPAASWSGHAACRPCLSCSPHNTTPSAPQFYNIPLLLETLPELTAFIKRLVRPGDFLAVKVDIDRTPWGERQAPGRTGQCAAQLPGCGWPPHCSRSLARALPVFLPLQSGPS